MGRILDNPTIWNFSRFLLDLSWGLYKKRFNIIKEWKIIEKDSSILDIGCGTGHYSKLTDERYVGIDLEEKYINYCNSKYQNKNKSFLCKDASSLLDKGEKFDIVLMVDFLHHISDKDCIFILKAAGELSEEYIINFEPLLEQDSFVGKWLIKLDRGEDIRTLESLYELYEKANLEIVKNKELTIGTSKSIAILAKINKN